MRSAKKPVLACVMLVGALTWGLHAAQDLLDKDLRTYQPSSGVSGNIKSVGSDTMNNMMALWGEDFRKHYPHVQIEIEGKGSSTAPPALIGGTSSFGPMSRKMKDKETESFEKRFGYKPTPLPTAIDILAIYVHKDNPISGITMQQADAIFSKSRKSGAPSDIKTWGDLGLTGSWANKPISLYGRNAASGTYGYFKKNVLKKGDYKDSVKEQPGSSSVVQGIANDKYAIGYSGIGYKTADVKTLALGYSPDQLIEAQPKYAYSGEYPLARFLYVYVNKEPGVPLDPMRREFIKFIFSRDGQNCVVRDGYFPVSAKIASDVLGKLGADQT